MRIGAPKELKNNNRVGMTLGDWEPSAAYADERGSGAGVDTNWNAERK
jgi:hypothetical protein